MARTRLIKALFTFSIVVLFLLVFFSTRIFQLKPKVKIDPSQNKEIIHLAAKSLKSLDVPVGAILIYNDSILGRGYNTVQADLNVAGHAEINAINDAVNKIGFIAFDKLDRNKLILVSSFEPCEMCKGAILHYNIEKVFIMKDKSPMYWNKIQFKSLDYEIHKRRVAGEKSQDSLFNLHPEYPRRK